ncbi:hypothetical protein [Comamonas sp. NoAH]|uniref:hypothetical protein n=1 Tax=Comamonas halotolerans TaxID=3041496 RepID=UPI0024E11ACD|nr:hypothetical protein [Comamonas sp. NoAH]
MLSFVVQLLAPPIWFGMCAALLLVVTRVYVRGLLVIGGFPRLFRVAIGALLWLLLSAMGVAPLFGWIAVTKLHLPDLIELPAMLWPMLCFGLCFAAMYHPIKRRLPQLQAAGFYRK